MNSLYKNKTIWIVGASSGIGEGLAYRLAKLGAKIILSARRETKLEKIKNSVACPQNLKILPLDLLDFDSLKEKTETAFSLFNTIDYIFLNGGTSARGFVNETDFKVHQQLMNLNYFSYVKLTQEILPFFLNQKYGHFVVTSSVMGKIGTPKRSAYAASKHALHGFYDCLRAEVASENIKVTVLIPGHVSTNISLNTLLPDGSKKGENTKDHENGMDPEQAAEQILKAVKKNKNEAYIGEKFNQEYLSLFAYRFFPTLLSKIVEKKIPS